jgi:large subunit ribosomal protein L6
MSRIGKAPINVPTGVDVTVVSNLVTVKGPKGTLSFSVPGAITVSKNDAVLNVARPDDERENRSLHGLTRTLVNNMVVGVTEGYERTLELVGVGYRAAMKGQALSMQLGFSHDVDIPAPTGISFAVPKQTEIKISGIDKQQVGELAARIRRIRPPEPYKGKGVRYAGEQVRRKEGKKK